MMVTAGSAHILFSQMSKYRAEILRRLETRDRQ